MPISTLEGPEGYKKLIVWQIAHQLRGRVYKITKRFPKTEIRRVSQMNDAARSAKQNIQEGYKQRSLGNYIRYLSDNAQPSLGELWGDIEDCYDDGLIAEAEFKELKELCGKEDYLLTRLIQSLIKKQRGETPESKKDRKMFNHP